jgi:hypothetical protein
MVTDLAQREAIPSGHFAFLKIAKTQTKAAPVGRRLPCQGSRAKQLRAFSGPPRPPTTQTYGGDPSHKFCIFPTMGRHILFKCPRLGTNVQHWLPETPPDEPGSNAYASVVCLACTRLHFIHKETGKLLGED